MADQPETTVRVRIFWCDFHRSGGWYQVAIRLPGYARLKIGWLIFTVQGSGIYERNDHSHDD